MSSLPWPRAVSDSVCRGFRFPGRQTPTIVPAFLADKDRPMKPEQDASQPAPLIIEGLLALPKTWLAVALFSLGVMLWSAAAQAVTYANASTTFGWIDASTHTKLGPTLGAPYSALYRFSNTGGCGTNPPSIDDTLSSNIPIGFTFMYGGVNFTDVRIMSNGRLQFNNNLTCGFGSPVTQLPYPNAGLNYTLRIYGGDLDPSLQAEIGGGYVTNCLSRNLCYVSYATLGTAPYRSFVVTWSNVPEWTSFASATGSYNVQVILQENGEFVYQYGTNVPGPGNTVAQVGWQVDSNDYHVPAVGYPPPTPPRSSTSPVPLPNIAWSR
jgi:MSHA biogenesis protein MshQ